MEYTQEQIERIEQDCPSVGDDEYREWLDSMGGDINVCGMTFQASRIIEELDPIAFRVGYSDFLDSMEYIEVNGEYYNQDDVDNCLLELEEEKEENEVDNES